MRRLHAPRLEPIFCIQLYSYSEEISEERSQAPSHEYAGELGGWDRSLQCHDRTLRGEKQLEEHCAQSTVIYCASWVSAKALGISIFDCNLVIMCDFWHFASGGRSAARHVANAI